MATVHPAAHTAKLIANQTGVSAASYAGNSEQLMEAGMYPVITCWAILAVAALGWSVLYILNYWRSTEPLLSKLYKAVPPRYSLVLAAIFIMVNVMMASAFVGLVAAS